MPDLLSRPSSSEVSDFLAHYGVKGMKWGVRKDEPSGGFALKSAPPTGVTISGNLQPFTKDAGTRVASLMRDRYGFNITELRELKPDNPEYKAGAVGFVQSTPGTAGGTIHIRGNDYRASLKSAEKAGWFAKGTGTPEAFITHEAGHALFHAEQGVVMGFFGPKRVGGEIKARDTAIKAALKEARKSGISEAMFSTSVSGYAAYSGMREEVEAELFSQYHWGTNVPRHVQVWGETLHRELGVDGTPFREGR